MMLHRFDMAIFWMRNMFFIPVVGQFSNKSTWPNRTKSLKLVQGRTMSRRWASWPQVGSSLTPGFLLPEVSWLNAGETFTVATWCCCKSATRCCRKPFSQWLGRFQMKAVPPLATSRCFVTQGPCPGAPTTTNQLLWHSKVIMMRALLLTGGIADYHNDDLHCHKWRQKVGIMIIRFQRRVKPPWSEGSRGQHGSIWALSAPGGSHVGPMNLHIWAAPVTGCDDGASSASPPPHQQPWQPLHPCSWTPHLRPHQIPTFSAYPSPVLGPFPLIDSVYLEPARPRWQRLIMNDHNQPRSHRKQQRNSAWQLSLDHSQIKTNLYLKLRDAERTWLMARRKWQPLWFQNPNPPIEKRAPWITHRRPLTLKGRGSGGVGYGRYRIQGTRNKPSSLLPTLYSIKLSE